MTVDACASPSDAAGLLYPRASIKVGLRIGIDVSGLLLNWDPKALLQHLRDLLSQYLIDLHLGEEVPKAALSLK